MYGIGEKEKLRGKKRKTRRGKKRHCPSFIIVLLVCHRTNFRLSTLRKATTETWGTGRGSKLDGHFIGPASTVVLQLCTIASSTMAYRGASSVSENRASIRDFSSSPSHFILLIFTLLLSAFFVPFIHSFLSLSFSITLYVCKVRTLAMYSERILLMITGWRWWSLTE